MFSEAYLVTAPRESHLQQAAAETWNWDPDRVRVVRGIAGFIAAERQSATDPNGRLNIVVDELDRGSHLRNFGKDGFRIIVTVTPMLDDTALADFNRLCRSLGQLQESDVFCLVPGETQDHFYLIVGGPVGMELIRDLEGIQRSEKSKLTTLNSTPIPTAGRSTS